MRPILSEADVTLANLETTLGGPDREFSGYPLFNTPDEAADAIKDAGVDILTTINNHSLNTRAEGLKRRPLFYKKMVLKRSAPMLKSQIYALYCMKKIEIIFSYFAYIERINGYRISLIRKLLTIIYFCFPFYHLFVKIIRNV